MSKKALSTRILAKFILIMFSTNLFSLTVMAEIIPPVDNSPKLLTVKAVPTQTFDRTPDFTFSSSEAGKISYSGACSASTNTAEAGENKITFDTLEIGMHANCVITVKGAVSGLISEVPLQVPAFEVKPNLVSSPDSVLPKLILTQGIDSPVQNETPSIVLDSNEAGTMTYEGSCVGMQEEINEGENTITLMSLPAGTYDNCKVRVTDFMGNVSDALEIPSFTVIQTLIGPVSNDVNLCAGFTDVQSNDEDCQAITYVKTLGAMAGNPDGTFAPDALLQRDQIAKITLVTFNKFDAKIDYCAGQLPFADLRKEAWSLQYICQAKLLGIVTGYEAGVDAGLFRPERNVIVLNF